MIISAWSGLFTFLLPKQNSIVSVVLSVLLVLDISRSRRRYLL